MRAACDRFGWARANASVRLQWSSRKRRKATCCPALRTSTAPNWSMQKRRRRTRCPPKRWSTRRRAPKPQTRSDTSHFCTFFTFIWYLIVYLLPIRRVAQDILRLSQAKWGRFIAVNDGRGDFIDASRYDYFAYIYGALINLLKCHQRCFIVIFSFSLLFNYIVLSYMGALRLSNETRYTRCSVNILTSCFFRQLGEVLLGVSSWSM